MLPPSKLVHEHTLSLRSVRVLSGFFLLLSTTSIASAQQPPLEGGGRNGPPPEAYTACESLNQGESCVVETSRGSLTGTCKMDRRNQSMVCVPTNRPNRKESSIGGLEGGPDQGSMRHHTVTQSNGTSSLYPAIVPPITASEYESNIEGDWRTIKANSISIHHTGVFPNLGNPNSIAEQDFNIRIPAKPVKTDTATRVKVPGYALNGVSFDPGAGEFYKGDPTLGWQYEALSGAVALGMDENHAHVQPNGKYHYHGLPTDLLARLNVNPGQHSSQIGWAVDGFPIYALYGFAHINGGGGIHEMKSSYRLKSGARPNGVGQPGGIYDGTFTADYEYVENNGDLDECNGRLTVTPDFPAGTYAYFLTDSYPVVPRCVMGTPDTQKQRF